MSRSLCLQTSNAEEEESAKDPFQINVSVANTTRVLGKDIE
jgi:hypothetical protein